MQNSGVEISIVTSQQEGTMSEPFRVFYILPKSEWVTLHSLKVNCIGYCITEWLFIFV